MGADRPPDRLASRRQVPAEILVERVGIPPPRVVRVQLIGFAAEAAESRRLGFDGKSLIHPNQIAPCHAAFSPSAEDIARAERLVAAAGGGAERFEGGMVERMHVEAAERLLKRR